MFIFFNIRTLCTLTLSFWVVAVFWIGVFIWLKYQHRVYSIHMAVKCCIWIWMRNLTGGTKEVPLLSTARDLKKPHQALLENITHDAIVLSSMWRSFRPFPSTWGNFTTHNFVIALFVKNSEIGQNCSNSLYSCFWWRLFEYLVIYCIENHMKRS